MMGNVDKNFAGIGVSEIYFRTCLGNRGSALVSGMLFVSGASLLFASGVAGTTRLKITSLSS